MTPERHEQVKQLFLAACSLGESDRAALLDKACRNDPELRAEIESLLRHHSAETLIRDPLDAEAAVRAAVAAAPTQTAHPTAGGPLFSSEDQQRFAAGTVVAERYRIVGLLGRGGMGEVYRADDLKLRRPVALKFLSRERVGDSVWLARFYNEVRLSLAVTHRHVCRVYDIVETAGEVFIAMEYIDGEDLGSLLRRVGRLPVDKALDITRQVCAGLAAAHSQRVLHRDLKPANIMIDGRGEVRITDFGIAALVGPQSSQAPLVGTPAYMAPELWTGQPPTVRGDVHAIGLVLYEMVTGRRALDGYPPDDARHQATVTSPGALVAGLDPAVERVILECLAENPDERPASAYAVVAALPSGDPLAAALAAGETPAPELVAWAGGQDGGRPRLAVAFLAAAVAVLISVVLLADRTFLLSALGLGKSPDVLEDKAIEIGQILIGSAGRLDGAGVFLADRTDRGHHGELDETELTMWVLPPAGQRPVVHFSCRWSGTPATRFAGSENPAPLPRSLPAAEIVLDSHGRLVAYQAAPAAVFVAARTSQPPDWSGPFQLAGLRIEDYQPVPPVRPPPLYADQHQTWQDSLPGDPATKGRVEAASLDGRMVYFEVVPPPAPASAPTSWIRSVVRQSAARQVMLVLYWTTFAAALPMAWDNLRRGRGDRRGASRLAALVLVLRLLLWAVQGTPPAATALPSALIQGVSLSVFAAVVVWVYYVAIEPYVRRFWPQALVSWSRLLSGTVRDSLVGSDVLLGVGLGALVILLQQVNVLASSGAALPIMPDAEYSLGRLVGPAHFAGVMAHACLTAVGRTMVLTTLMLLLRKVLGGPWLAGGVFFVAVAAAYVLSAEVASYSDALTYAAISALVAVMLMHAGCLATMVSFFAAVFLRCNPVTAHGGAWYGQPSALALSLLGVLLVLGFWVALPRPRRGFRTAVPPG